MSDLNIFGPMVVDTELGTAIEATLEQWLPTYLAYINRALVAAGINVGGDLPAPGAYVHSSDANHFPEETPPAVVIAIPGTLGEPRRYGGTYRAFWDVRIVCYVDGPSRDLTEALAKYYATAIRGVMVHKPSLGNFADATVWRGTQYGTRVSDRSQRTLGSCEVRFSVDVRDVVQEFAGPQNPITSIPADWPTATTVKVTPSASPIS